MAKRKVISRRNAGFGDNLFAAAHAWYYAKETNRTLVINWAPSMYLEQKKTNAFGCFFEVQGSISGTPIIVEKNVGLLKRFYRQLPVFPLRYFLPTLVSTLAYKTLKERTPPFFLHVLKKRRKKHEEIIRNGIDVPDKTVVFNNDYSFLIRETKPFFDELKLKREYQKVVDEFSNRYFSGKQVLGVHIRSYNKNIPSNHNKYWLDEQKSLNKIKDRIQYIIAEQGLSNYVIFLATDSLVAQEFCKKNLRNVVTYNKNFQIKTTFSHHLKVNFRAAADALIDMFLLAKSDILYRFPPTGSWFSHYASLYAKETIM